MSDNIISKKKKNKKKVKKSFQKPMEVLNEDSNEESGEVSSDSSSEEAAKTVKEHRIRKAIADKIRRSYEFPLWKWLIILLVVSLFEGVLLEMLGRRSLLSPFVFIIHNPLVFVYNVLILFCTLSIGLMFKRRGFAMGLIFLLWFAVGFINFVLLGYRITPFSAIDFLMFTDVLSMFNIYFNLGQRIAIVVGIIVFIIIIVLAFLKIPKIKGKVNYVQGSIVVLISFVFVYIMTFLALENSLISDKFTNLGTAYKSYGFVYCFSNSVIDQGISKPDDYNQASMDSLMNDLKHADKPERHFKYKNNKKQLPDIIVIQLESFIDIGRVNNVTTDKESIPNFKKFEEEYPSGFLTVPAIGAGTANTEFEIVTGMNSKVFGAGEYPYKTILTETPCESMAQLLLREGYGTHAIHNNKAKFYSRDITYANLGFQTFTSLEYMLDFNRTETGWAKDDCLPTEIINALDYDEEPDFVFTISVQGHGRYPKTKLKCEEHVHVEVQNEDEELAQELSFQFGYFVNQCYEMDEMIADLKKRLDERGDDYVLLLYGDHIPSLSFDDDQFNSGTQSQTEYVIVNNIGLDLEDRDMYAYEMSDYLMRGIGFEGGVMQKIHNRYYNDDPLVDNHEYHRDVLLAEYDMLYGDHFVYNYIKPYEKQDMRLGLYDITVSNMEYNAFSNSITVRGENFTPFSKILINDERQETLYVDSTTLMIVPDDVDKMPEVDDEYCVAQIDKDKHELSRSNTKKYGRR